MLKSPPELLSSIVGPPPVEPLASYTTTTSKIQKLLDKDIILLSKPWTAPIYMEVVKVDYYDTIDEKTFEQPREWVNICDYFDGEKYPAKRLYFSSAKYPPPRCFRNFM